MLSHIVDADAQKDVYEGIAEIKVEGQINNFVLYINEQEIETFDTYTDALTYAIAIVNEIG